MIQKKMRNEPIRMILEVEEEKLDAIATQGII
jgi:hypothetical protein